MDVSIIMMWRVGTAVALIEDRDCMGTVTGYIKTLDGWRVVVDLDEAARWTSARPSGDRSGPSVFAMVAVPLDAVERLDVQGGDPDAKETLFRAGSTIYVVDQQGATFVTAAPEDQAAVAAEEARQGAVELTTFVCVAPRDMTADEAADYACSHGPDGPTWQDHGQTREEVTHGTDGQ